MIGSTISASSLTHWYLVNWYPLISSKFPYNRSQKMSNTNSIIRHKFPVYVGIRGMSSISPVAATTSSSRYLWQLFWNQYTISLTCTDHGWLLSQNPKSKFDRYTPDHAVHLKSDKVAGAAGTVGSNSGIMELTIVVLFSDSAGIIYLYKMCWFMSCHRF